jgi:iron(III) transport system substrate-binding protein
MSGPSITRRELLAGLAAVSASALAGCGPGTPAAPAPPAGAAPAASGGASSGATGWQAEWDRTLAAARQEGKLSILIPPGETYRSIYEAFEQKFGIPVELRAGAAGSDIPTRLDLERKAGQFLWDAMVHSGPSMYRTIKPMGAFDPLRPALILPEVLDDANWRKGFGDGWMDPEGAYVYATAFQVSWSVYVNRNVVPESELSRIDQLWDPRWRGKMAWQEPRTSSAGAAVAAVFRYYKGEERVIALIRDQQGVLTRDGRQLAEWVIRGQYPISLGLSQSQTASFQQQGLNIDHIQPLMDSDPAAARVAASNSNIAIINRAPHPNAAAVLANWFLTREGQMIHSKQTDNNSRRLDVPIQSPETAPEPTREYMITDRHDHYDNVANTITLLLNTFGA